MILHYKTPLQKGGQKVHSECQEFFYPDERMMFEISLNDKLEKTTKILNTRSYRFLTLFGKVTVESFDIKPKNKFVWHDTCT